MKVMFFIPTLKAGGAERVVSVLANEMVGRDTDVSVCLIKNDSSDYKLSPKVSISCINSDDDLGLSSIKRVRLRLKKIRKAVEDVKPDVVISFMANTNIDVCMALKGLNIPIIVSERNDPKLDPPSSIKKLIRRHVYKRASGYVFQTPEAKEYFSRSIQRKGTIILNPLVEDIPDVYDGVRDNRIVAVGRLADQKNYPLLINAYERFMNEHPEYVLEIYGEGVLRKEIEALISTKGLSDRITLAGYSKDVHSRIKTAGFYVMSSDYEGLPNALIEAMALGLPCISTDCPCGGPRMLICHGENGLLVPVGDEDSLAKAMCSMANDRIMAESMGRKAALVRERVDVKVIVDQWVRHIESILQ